MRNLFSAGAITSRSSSSLSDSECWTQVWLLEGLLPYISRERMPQLAKDIGALSAAGSGLWGDGFSKSSVDRGMVFHGVPFESGFTLNPEPQTLDPEP